MSKSFKDLQAISSAILEGNFEKKKAPTAPMVETPTGRMPDIRNIEITADDMGTLLETTTKPNLSEDRVTEVKVIEERMTNLITQLKTLLGEAKQVLSEVTTVGMIGVNNKFSLHKGKKNEPRKVNKGNKSNSR